MKGYEMNCRICGRQDARIRPCEVDTARITKRAHVDCHGHSEYRSVTTAEIDVAFGEHNNEARLRNEAEDAVDITSAIDTVVDSFDQQGE